MQDPFANRNEEIEIHPVQKVRGTVAGLFKAQGKSFQTEVVEELPLTFDGIPGDFHAGQTRRSGGREPWYPRGTEMRNERQLSILCPQELRAIARRIDVPELKAQWMGGNMLLEGIENLTMLPARTLIFFEGGVTIKIDGDNAPCRVTGRAIASQFDGRNDVETTFPREARRLRGLVGWVEKEGVVKTGEAFEARIPSQWIYTV